MPDTLPRFHFRIVLEGTYQPLEDDFEPEMTAEECLEAEREFAATEPAGFLIDCMENLSSCLDDSEIEINIAGQS